MFESLALLVGLRWLKAVRPRLPHFNSLPPNQQPSLVQPTHNPHTPLHIPDRSRPRRKLPAHIQHPQALFLRPLRHTRTSLLRTSALSLWLFDMFAIASIAALSECNHTKGMRVAGYEELAVGIDAQVVGEEGQGDGVF
jgi:hypothetical protein